MIYPDIPVAIPLLATAYIGIVYVLLILVERSSKTHI